jgi:hypothetical protein
VFLLLIICIAGNSNFYILFLAVAVLIVHL